MKNRPLAGLVFPLACLLAVFLAAIGRAQLVPDGGTNIVNAVTVSGTTTNYIGSNAPNSFLSITNGGVVTNNYGILGLTAASTNNRVLVTGVNSRWTNSADLTVGLAGAFNRLVISNGGFVRNNLGVVGGSATSSNNTVVVTGAGSQWINANSMSIGSGGGGNLLIVSNSGFVSDDYGFIGANNGGSNNTVIITGAGSRWTNFHDLFVGSSGGGSRLIVTNAGTVQNNTGYLGFTPTGDNNLALVSGTNSLWSNLHILYIGYGGAGSTLIVSNGATVLSSNGIVGFNSAASNNLAFVTGAGARWLTLSNLTVGSTGARNQLVVSNGGLVVDTFGFLGAVAASANNFAAVSGTNSRWSNQFDLHVGEAGSTNILLITNGGFVWSSNGAIGFTAASSNNLVLVDDPGSLWTNVSQLAIGSAGSGNQLMVSNGAAVRSFTGFVGFTSSNNLAIVTGPGSSWTNRNGLTVGGVTAASGNWLMVSNGGAVFDGASSAVGNASAGGSNGVTVTGTGSVWTAQSLFIVGNAGSWNQLLVSTGGVVISAAGYVGALADTSGGSNSVLVTGAGALWTNASTLYVGVSNTANQLVVSNAGTVAAGGLVIGSGGTALGSRVTLDGGTLTATNPAFTSTTEVRNGTLQLNTGTLLTDRLLLTNGPAGQFLLRGGTLTSGASFVSNALPFLVGTNTNIVTLNLTSNGTRLHTFSGGLQISSNSTLRGIGTVFAAVTNFGTVAPGVGVGALTISGSLVLRTNATLSFEVAGLIPTNSYDVLNVSSFVQLAGRLSLSLINGYYPDTNAAFTLFTFASASGAFTNATNAARLSTSDNAGTFLFSLTATNVVVRDFRSPDTDGDGQTDYAELLAGTIPTDSSSVLSLTPVAVSPAGQVTLQFFFVIGKNYRLLYTDNLGSGTWNVINAPIFTQPAASLNQWIDDGTLTGGLPFSQRYYRVGLAP